MFCWLGYSGTGYLSLTESRQSWSCDHAQHAQLLCTESKQLALGSTGSAGRENLLYKAHLCPWPFSPDHTTELLFWLQFNLGLLWCEGNCWDAGILWHSGMQGCKFDSMWSLPAPHVKARCLSKHLYGKPCQFRSAVKLGGPGHFCLA